MADENKTIGYRPQINYTENYDTDRGTYERQSFNDSLDNNRYNPITTDDIEEEIIKIDRSLNNFLPTKLKDDIYEVYKPLRDTYYNFLKGQLIYNRSEETKFIDNSINAEYGIFLNRKAVSIKKGSEILLKAFCVPSSDASNVIAKWESNNEKVAIVDEDGIVTGLEVGTAIIRVTSSYNKTDECIVSVLDTGESENNRPDINPDPGDKPTIEPPDNNTDDDTIDDNDGTIHIVEVALDRTNIIVKVGKTKQLHATIYPKNATNKKLIWSSSRNSCATVDDDGTVHGVTPGTCIVTVSSEDGNKSDTCNVLVIKDNTGTSDPNPSGPGINPNPNPKPPSGGGNEPTIPDHTPPTTPPGYNPSKPDYEPDNPDDKPIADDPNVIIIDPTPSPTPTIVEDEFKKNLYDLIKYYMNRLNEVLGRYHRAFFSTINKKDLNDFFFIYNDIQISNKDIVSSYRHLLDNAIKSQNISNLKLDFYNSNFNFNQALYQLKNFLAMYEFRKKYESIPYSNGADKSNSYSNKVLKSLRHEYSLKYDKAYENLYKYLDSSITITESIVSELIQNVFSKGILTEKGGLDK